MKTVCVFVYSDQFPGTVARTPAQNIKFNEKRNFLAGIKRLETTDVAIVRLV